MSVLQSTLDMASGGQSIVDRMQAAIHTIDGSEMAKTVCKASTHEMGAPKKKHLDKLQDMTRQPNINQPELLNHIVLRTKEKSWIVVFKALVTCHHLLTHGHEKILQAAASRATLFFLENYNDSTSPQGYEMSPFVRRYAGYLNEKANAYRSVAFDFAKLKRGKDSIWNKYTIEKLNTQLLVFQKLIQKAIDLKPKAVTLNNPVINSAFALVHRDLIRLYQCYNDAIIVVIDKFMSLKHVQAKQSLEIFRQFIKHCDEINEFFKISQRVGLDNKGELPDFSEAPKKLLPTFEEFVRSGASGEGSSAGSPVKSAVSSPVNDLTSALKQEEEALARFKANAKSQSPPTVTAPPKKEPESALNDLLSLGNELSFGSSIVNQANQPSVPLQNTSRAMFASQPVPPAQNNQNFDPFNFGAPQQSVQQPTGAFNQNQNLFGGEDQYQKPSSSNPFNFMDQEPNVSSFQQQSTIQQSNPFKNPFAGSNVPLSQPAPSTVQSDPFSSLNMFTPTQQTQAPVSNDPFNLSNMTAPTNQTQQFAQPNNNNTLSSMMTSLDMNSTQNSYQPAQTSNPNNPFAF